MYDDEEVDRIRYAFEHGFQVSSHTWGHKDLTTLSKEEMSEEMRKTQEAIFKITGSYPSYTRPRTSFFPSSRFRNAQWQW